MKYAKFPALAVLVCLAAVWADGVPSVEWSGFFSSYWDSADDGYVLGPAELDFFAQLHPRFSANGAIVGEYDFTENAAEVSLGTAFLDIRFYEGSDTASDRPLVGHSGFTTGLFDVPFGIDYLYYADPDRRTVSAPLTADYMFDGGWTDVGVMFYTTLWAVDVKAYSVNGFTEHPGAGVTVDVVPAAWADFGASYAVGLNRDNDVDWDRIGAHVKTGCGGVEVSGEYIFGTDGKTEADLKHKGFYAQGTFDFSEYVAPVYVGARYGRWLPDYDGNGDGTPGNDDLTRTTVYGGVRLVEAVTVKAEYQLNDGEENAGGLDDDIVYGGAVVGF
jgi:hypothetical protein